MNRWNYLQAKLFFSSSLGNMSVPLFMLNSDIQCLYKQLLVCLAFVMKAKCYKLLSLWLHVTD